MSGGIALSNVTKRYGGKTVFESLTVSFPSGQRVCLMGPSGCGKTTLLRLVMGLERPDAGCVSSVDKVSAVFQEDRLLPLQSALGNLRFTLGRGQDERIKSLLFELGLGEDLETPVGRFSGGMKRRVAIARALGAEYDLLLLDEPFKGLDEQNKTTAARVIRRCLNQKTLIMVTHDKAEAGLMDARVMNLPAYMSL